MSLYFSDAGLSPLEVPNEMSLCIYISGCTNRCHNCHYPELQIFEYGNILRKSYLPLTELYSSYATCVCFLGEGANRNEEHTEFKDYCRIANGFGIKTCLYSGRNTQIEEWMQIFDYIKLGNYNEKLGPLDKPTTNQRMYKKTDDFYIDITSEFWK